MTAWFVSILMKSLAHSPLDFSGEKTDLLTDKTIAIDHTIQLDAYRAYILK